MLNPADILNPASSKFKVPTSSGIAYEVESSQDGIFLSETKRMSYQARAVRSKKKASNFNSKTYSTSFNLYNIHV